MAQAACTLPPVITPENTENASESPRAVPRYIIGLPSGRFVADYVDEVLTETPSRSEAKVFWSKRRAIVNAEIFDGEVLPAETLLPVEPCHESNVAMLARLIIESSRIAAFSGIQRGFHRKKVAHPPLVLFSSVKTGNALALPIRQLSRSSVIAAVEASDKTFERYARVSSRSEV